MATKSPSPNTKPTDMGMNRTGISASPLESRKTVEGADAGGPEPVPEPDELSAVREAVAQGAPPVGTMPPPASIKGAVKATAQALKGNSALVFLDLLGERLAYERTGARLYDALLCKLAAADPRPGGPTREGVEQIRDEELQHLVLVKGAIESLGGDPTVVTPSADVAGVSAMGWVQALADPRVTLTEALKVMLAAELADNDAWQTLADVAAGLGHDQLATSFRDALAEEDDHLARVRTWLTLAVAGQAGIDLPVDAAEAVTGRGAPPP
jgi:rubrerythrin